MSYAKRLAANVWGADKQKLKEYLISILDVERRIQDTEKSKPTITMLHPDPSIPTGLSEHARIMIDVMALAFQTDATPVVTLILALEQSPARVS